MPPNARFRGVNSNLKWFCEKELTKVVPGGVVGAILWKVYVDCYALKCTKNNTQYLQELASVFHLS